MQNTETTQYLNHTITVTGIPAIRDFGWTVTHPDGTTHTSRQRYKAPHVARRDATAYVRDLVQPAQTQIADDRFSVTTPAPAAPQATSRRDYPRHADQASGYLTGAFGLTSPASSRGECHYCGARLTRGQCEECQ